MVNGLGVSAGAALGAALVGEAASAPASLAPFQLAFVVSAGLRVLGWVALARFVREVRAQPQSSLREVVLDVVGQRLVLVLGYFSVRPEQERRGRSRERGPRDRNGREGEAVDPD